MFVCQFAKNEQTIPAPADPHAGGLELFLGRVAPRLLHLQGWRIGKSGADRIAISDVKAR
jgi:hypothetical protein